ncbi:MAG TPA: hypothetical protein VFU46_14590 [Gemmatimonadales bacterium]|nr:hypothetical protein [Gemmatimonadales bacterium]
MRTSIATGLGALAACQLATTRPSFEPVPEARHAEVRLPRAEATRLLAEALREDSVPVALAEPRDGYVVTPWFDSTGVAASPDIGTGVVRVRGWVEPARVGSSELIVETVYRPMLDPSLPERELERAVAPDHPVAVRVDSVLARLARRYEGEFRGGR